MPAAALEKWSQINEVSIDDTVDAWAFLPRPLSHFKKNVMGFSFSGILAAIDKYVLATPEMDDATRKSLGRAAQMIGFEHVAQKVVLGIKTMATEDGSPGRLVVSGGVASNQMFRKTYPLLLQFLTHCSLRRFLDNGSLENYELIFPPVEYCTVLSSRGTFLTSG